MKAYYEDRNKISNNKELLEQFPLEAVIKQDSFRAHWHHEIEIILVTKGSVRIGINAKTKVLTAGDAVFSNSGDVHFFETLNPDTKMLIIVFKPAILGNLINLLNFSFDNPFFTRETCRVVPGFSIDIYEKITSLLLAIYNEMQVKDACFEMLVRSHIIEVLGLLLRYFPHHVRNVSHNKANVKSKSLVQFALHYIENNYTNNISLKGVASYLGISEYYLSRLFNQLTGQAFRTYLNNIRLDHAQKLLSTTEKSIIDIAYESGFNSLRTFNRVYKDVKGVIPSDYR